MRLEQYNCYPGSGWVKFGKLVVNFHRNTVNSIFYNGEQIWSRC
jgi:hypothetical protein